MQNIPIDKNQSQYLQPKVNVNCPIHTWQKAQSICCQLSCTKNAVLCAQCDIDDDNHIRDHKKNIKPIDQFIQQATDDIETNLKGNKEIYKEIFQQSENKSLLKYHTDSDIHLQKVKSHIQGQQIMISEDIGNMLNWFTETCNIVKQNLFQKLDSFYIQYEQSFHNHRDFIEENFKLSKNYQFYNNSNNLGAKLSSELPKNANIFVKELKQAIEKAKNMNSNKSVYVNSVKKMSSNINKMMDQLPMFLPINNFEPLMKDLQGKCEQFFIGNLQMEEDFMKYKVEKELLVESKKMNFQILNDNKNLLTQSSEDEIQLKPVKKYQLDIPVTAMTALSDIHLALASSHDSKLRIFESQQKKIHTIQAHSQPITFLTKIITEEKYMTQNKENSNKEKSNKKVLLVSASQDYSVILWTFDYEMKQNPQVYSKLVGFQNIPMNILDLQDQQNIITGDNFGELCIWDAHQAKQISQNNNQHSKKITGISLSKKFEKFISVSEDNLICIWKLNYQGTNIQGFNLENKIYEDFGGITSLNLSIKDPNLVYLGTKIGALKLYDIKTQKLLAETNAHQSPVLDLSLLEENISSKDSNNKFSQKMALLSLGVRDKYIRMWKISKSKETKEYEFTGLKLDVNIYNEDEHSKSKVQILKGSAPKFILANEKNKELLVYEIFH